MNRIGLVVAVVCLFAAAARAQQPNPLAGTWKTNVAKSKVSLGGAPTTQVVKYEAVPNGIKYSSDRVAGDGTKSHVEFTAHFDGSTAPYKGVQDRDGISIRKIDPYTYQVFYKLHGEVTQINFWIVSPDRKTLTTVSTGVGSDNKVFNRLVVADRQ